MGYDMSNKSFNKELDLKKLKPYGDTMNDGKVQVSFTLPVANDEQAGEAAKELAKKMGLENPLVAESISIDETFTMFVIYGNLSHTVNYDEIEVVALENDVLSKYEIEDFIAENFNNNIVVVGASTGTDAHTVGIDASMNMKGFAGHYGLERYRNIDAYNMGSSVENEDMIKKALELDADVLLISQTVTQKDVHIKNLVNMIELLEIEGLRDRFVLIVGGPRINHELAKELGYDAGFGPKKYAEDVASFFIKELNEK